MQKIRERTKEYGGFIPFDFPQGGKELYGEFEEYLIRVNSARAGIIVAIKDFKPKRIFMPIYTCPSVKKAALDLGIEVKFYQLKNNMLPEIESFFQEDILIWTNYFGIMPNHSIEEVLRNYNNIIFDNAQAFFAKPILKKGVYNVYSCRKFIGVPDGGYVIAEGLEKPKMEQDVSYFKMNFLFKQLEVGTDSAYNEYLENEEIIDNRYLEMSILTKHILGSVDYEFIAEQRRKNYKKLHTELGNINELEIEINLENEAVPLIYPMVVKSEATRASLISKKIYIPTWWKHLEQENISKNSVEYNLTKYLLPLPIDQRYSWQDMEEISSIIKKIFSMEANGKK